MAIKQELLYKSRDGELYSTLKALEQADEAWKRKNLRPINNQNTNFFFN
jgi:hypothetical protein